MRVRGSPSDSPRHATPPASGYRPCVEVPTHPGNVDATMEILRQPAEDEQPEAVATEPPNTELLLCTHGAGDTGKQIAEGESKTRPRRAKRDAEIQGTVL